MKVTASVKRCVTLFDLHCGWERRRKGTEVKVCPTHNVEATAAAMSFVKDFKPDMVVLGGDQINFAPISHWNKGKLWANDGMKIKREMDILNNAVLGPIEEYCPKAEKKYMIGNHDQWVYDFIDENPAIEGLIEPENYLNLKPRGWEVVGQGEMVWLSPHCGIVHGDNVKNSTKPAYKAMEMYQCNIRQGHHHKLDSYTQYNAADAKDFKTSLVVPCLATTNAVYNKNAPNRCLNGFLFTYIWPNGYFTDYVVVMADNSFVAPGSNKIYRGRELAKVA